MLVNVVNGANVGMVQCGGGTGFPLEAFQGYGGCLLVPLSGTQHLLGQELEGHKRAKAEILGLVNHPPMPPPPSFSRMR